MLSPFILHAEKSIGQVTKQADAENSAAPLAHELRVPYWIDGKGNQREAFLLNSEENSGKWVFLKCFQNWCPGCHAHGFPTLQTLIKHYGTQHEQIVFAGIQTTFEGYYTNNIDALRPLQLRYELDIPFGHDQGDQDLKRNNPGHYPKTMVDYRTRGTPWLILITPNREVVYSYFHADAKSLIEKLDSILLSS